MERSGRRQTVAAFGMLLLLLVAAAGSVQAFIVPQEVPSILSLVYSNIPPVKKGTDSRLGFGYRLGEHADFQVVLELGPQTETKPLGTGSFSASSDTSKRQVNQDDYDFMPAEVVQKSPNPVGSKWLSNWSQDMKNQQRQRRPLAQTTTNDQGTDSASLAIQTRPFIAESSLRQLQQLYGKGSASAAAASTNPQPVAADAVAAAAVGTLPASSMAAVVEQLNKVRFGNSVVPKATAKRHEERIKADLMDVDLS